MLIIFSRFTFSTIADSTAALLIAKEIAKIANVYLWDFSTDNGNYNLFETLTNGKPGYILKRKNLVIEEATELILYQMISESTAANCYDSVTTERPESETPYFVFQMKKEN